VIADELGPSLRWATAQVERTPKTDGQGQGQGQGGASRGANPGTDVNPHDTGEEPF